MDKLRSGIEFIFSSYKRTAAVLAVAALALAIPVTLSISQQQQDLRQRASQVCANVAADIMLVIDKSGSMNDKTSNTDSTSLMQKAKTAANKFVDTVAANTQNRIGVTSYSSEFQTTLNHSLSNNFSGAKQSISNLIAIGETCTQCGIKKANQEISQKKRSGFKNAVILLTDGRANAVSGSSSNNEAAAETAAVNEAKAGKNANDTAYFTIGLGSKVNAQFLQQIANETGGKYFFAPTADDLQSIYTQISQIVGKGSVSGFVYDDANGNGIMDTTETKLSGWTTQVILNGQTTGTNATTDTTGGFSITGVCDGEYKANVTVKTGYSATQPANGTQNVIVVNGDNKTDVNFGVKTATPATATPAPCPTAPLCQPGQTLTTTQPASGSANTCDTFSCTGTTTCGDGICQNASCTAVNVCPVAESITNCPQDCSVTSTPSVTTTPAGTTLKLNLQLTGIGVASNSALGLNSSPKRPTRSIQATVINAQNQQVASSSGTANFNTTTGYYNATLTLGNNFQTGAYLVKVRMDNTLWKTIPGIQNITSGSEYQAPLAQLVSGDVNQDNEINLIDYTRVIGCIQGKETCTNSTLSYIGDFFASIVGFIKDKIN